MGKPEMNRLGSYGIAFLMGNFAAVSLMVVPGKWNVLVYLVFMPCTHVLCEPRKRAHSPLAAGLASVSENGKLPYGRGFPAACCRVFNTCTKR
jgi:hypothetical protein